MSNKTRTYILDINDPLRLDLNSYWRATWGDFALEVLGESTLMQPQYSPAALEMSLDNFYKKRQTIKVIKQSAFDAAQGLLLEEDDSGQTFAAGSTSFEDYVKSRFIPYFDNHNSLSTADKDNIFQVYSPIVTKDFSTTSDPSMGINEVKEEFLINFLEKRFEDAIAPSAISELSLPNFYDVIKVGGNPPQDSYFDDYANNVPSPDNRYENIMISMDNYKEMERINGFDKVFPLEVKISPYNAAVSRMTGFHDALDSSNLDLTLIDLMSRRGDIQHVGGTVLNSHPYRMIELEILPSSGAQKTAEAEVKLESLDMLAWSRDISDVIDSLTDISPTSNKIYLGPDNQSINIAKGDAGTLREVLSSAMFLGKVKDLIRNNLRSFSDINRGDKSYSEIVFYKIEKYTSPDAPTPIQKIWIPNIDQVDPIEYVDTQVKYNKEYTYKVYAYSAVIGTKYYYDTSTYTSNFLVDIGIISGGTNLTTTGIPTLNTVPTALLGGTNTTGVGMSAPNPSGPTTTGNFTIGTTTSLPSLIDDTANAAGILTTGAPSTSATIPNAGTRADLIDTGALSGQHSTGTPPSPQAEYFQIDVITEPTVELIKTELFMFSGLILDDPPMIPDVKFTSYIGIDNKITVNMQAQIGEYKAKPIILNSEDSDFIDSLRLARGYPSGSLITYKTDDETSAFEVYRMETMPTSYDDFSNNLRTTISTLQRDSFSTIYSWDMSHMDTVMPNKEYYYMVRSVDIHNHKSYPSPVYKIQMVNDSGAIYPLVEVIEMKPKEKPRMKTKNFKKFLQLVPSLAQISLDYGGSNLITQSGLVANSALGKEADIVLGTATPKLFGNSSYGQTFKIRLISKNTGKKLDLNVTFKVENDL